MSSQGEISQHYLLIKHPRRLASSNLKFKRAPTARPSPLVSPTLDGRGWLLCMSAGGTLGDKYVGRSGNL